MKWSELSLHPTPKILRQFAGAWLVFFLALGAHQYFAKGHQSLGLALAALAVLGGGAGLAWPAALRWIFVGWLVVAFPIGWLVSQAMLALMFYVVLTPIAVVLRLRGRDSLCRRPAPGQPSFWVPKETPKDVRGYFRQY